MRRETLFAAARRVREDLENSGIVSMLEKGTEAARRREPSSKDAIPSWISFEVFQKYTLLVSKYGAAEQHVLEVLGLSEFSSALFWSKLSEADTPEIFGLRSRIRFALDHLPRLLSLIEQDYVEAIRNQDVSAPPALSGKTLLTVVLVESDAQFSSPSRLIYALDAIAGLYHVFAVLEGEADSDLSVLACDSGSDKSFDFLGLAKLMEEVRKLIVSIWDRRVFYRHMHVSQCIGTIAESLPVIERIHALRESGALGPEQAELLKRRTIDSATKFLESGSLISDMERESVQSPRLLMRVEPKLLAAPNNAPAPEKPPESVPPEDQDSATMSREEIEQLERLVEKAKGSRSDSRKKRGA